MTSNANLVLFTRHRFLGWPENTLVTRQVGVVTRSTV